MNMRMYRRVGRYAAALSLVILIAGAFGCSGEKPPAEVQAPPAVSPQGVVPPAAPQKTAEAVMPEHPRIEAGPADTAPTAPFLRLMPEGTAMAAAAPTLTELADLATVLAKRVAPASEVDAMIADMISNLNRDLGEPVEGQAGTLADVIRAKGYDPASPAALFVNPERSVVSMKSLVAQALAEKAAVQSVPLETPAPLETTPAVPAPPAAGSAETEAAPPAEAPPAAAPAPVPVLTDAEKGALMQKVALPEMVGVIGIVDAAKAEATLKKEMEEAGLAVDSLQEERVGGVVIRKSDSAFAYAVLENALVLGNSVGMVKATLDRFLNPAPLRYGTPEFPEPQPDQLVMVTFVDRVMPVIEAAASLNSDDAFSQFYSRMMGETAAAYGGEPAITVLNLTGDNLELVTRLDQATHPGLAQMVGAATPFQLAAMVPESTVLLFAQRFSPERIAHIKDKWLNTLPGATDKLRIRPEELAVIGQVFDQIGDELVVAAAAEAPGIPTMVIMARLRNPEQAREFLKDKLPLIEQETHNEVTINMVSVPSPIPLYASYVGDVLVLGNELSGLKGMIDRIKGNGATAFFDNQRPPLERAQPYYGILLIRSELVTNVVQPYFGMLPIPAQVTTGVQNGANIIDSIRAATRLNGTWYEQVLRVDLKPAPVPEPSAAGN